MRSFLAGLVLCVFSSFCLAQETASNDSNVPVLPSNASSGEQPSGTFAFMRPQNVKALLKHQLKKAIDGKPYPLLQDWEPLTTRQKFHFFVAHTYSPNTFLGAGIDALKFSTLGKGNPEYERGIMGFGQRYGINLATSETNVFFGKFLFASVLKQDPRYFRNPELPFFKRALYSISRVLITRADSGCQTFNASQILGAASSQAIADLYVPGERQGFNPIWGRVTFDLVRDAGLNMIHEFWPDIHRGLIHRFKFIRNVSSRLD